MLESIFSICVPNLVYSHHQARVMKLCNWLITQLKVWYRSRLQVANVLARLQVSLFYFIKKDCWPFWGFTRSLLIYSIPTKRDRGKIGRALQLFYSGYELVDVRKGRFSPYIKSSLMLPLEEQISARRKFSSRFPQVFPGLWEFHLNDQNYILAAGSGILVRVWHLSNFNLKFQGRPILYTLPSIWSK